MSDTPSPPLSSPPQLDGAQGRQVLREFSRALGQESHNLQRWPETIWQQLANRLGFSEPPVPELIAPDVEWRSQPGATPWFRAVKPSPESRALIRVLDGHTAPVMAVAWRPDGTRLASESNDHTVRVWEAASGALLETVPLRGVLDWLAFSPSQPRLAVRNNVGEVWIGDWLPEPYGPLVVTVVDVGSGPQLRCHGCGQRTPVTADRLGQVLACPGCDLMYRLNRFVTKRYPPALREWEALPWWRKLFTRRPVSSDEP